MVGNENSILFYLNCTYQWKWKSNGNEKLMKDLWLVLTEYLSLTTGFFSPIKFIYRVHLLQRKADNCERRWDCDEIIQYVWKIKWRFRFVIPDTGNIYKWRDQLGERNGFFLGYFIIFLDWAMKEKKSESHVFEAKTEKIPYSFLNDLRLEIFWFYFLPSKTFCQKIIDLVETHSPCILSPFNILKPQRKF